MYHTGPCAASRVSPLLPREVVLLAVAVGFACWLLGCGIYNPTPIPSLCFGGSYQTKGTIAPMSYACVEWELK